MNREYMLLSRYDSGSDEYYEWISFIRSLGVKMLIIDTEEDGSGVFAKSDPWTEEEITAAKSQMYDDIDPLEPEDFKFTKVETN